MFCGNFGTESVEGDHFCIACGRAQSPTQPAQSLPAPHSKRPPAEMVKPATNAATVERTVSAAVTSVNPGERPVYCRHSLSERAHARGREGPRT